MARFKQDETLDDLPSYSSNSKYHYVNNPYILRLQNDIVENQIGVALNKLRRLFTRLDEPEVVDIIMIQQSKLVEYSEKQMIGTIEWDHPVINNIRSNTFALIRRLEAQLRENDLMNLDEFKDFFELDDEEIKEALRESTSSSSLHRSTGNTSIQQQNNGGFIVKGINFGKQTIINNNKT